LRRRRELDPATNKDAWGRGWRGCVPHHTNLDPAALEAVVVVEADRLSGQEERSVPIRFDPLDPR